MYFPQKWPYFDFEEFFVALYSTQTQNYNMLNNIAV